MDCRVAALLAMTNFISAPRNDKLAVIHAMTNLLRFLQ